MTSLPPQVLKGLAEIFARDQILREESERWAYGYDNSRLQQLPDVVVFPTGHEQVRDTLQLCNEHGVPVTTRGRGTGTTGAAVPLAGGLVLAMERLCRIGEPDSANRFLRAESGATNAAVQEKAASRGFFWAPDPTSAPFCTIGGNLACNAAGPRAIKYGTPRENVLGLRAVTGEGREIRTGVLTTKGVVGYDLTRLLIGSEGTLAVITEATLRLTPLPQAVRTLLLSYADIEAATRAITDIMCLGNLPRSLEFMDARAIAMIRDYADCPLPATARAVLIVEVDGDADQLEGMAARVMKTASNERLLTCLDARDAEQADAIWRMRKALSPALRTVAPKKINEDVVVPVSRIPRLISGLEALAEKYALPIVNFGHAGNGNIHVNLLLDPDQPEEAEKAAACLDEIFDLVLSLDGTLSGEHGIGYVKREFVQREIDAASLELMHRIKAQFDPNGILNPGKTI